MGDKHGGSQSSRYDGCHGGRLGCCSGRHGERIISRANGPYQVLQQQGVFRYRLSKECINTLLEQLRHHLPDSGRHTKQKRSQESSQTSAVGSTTLPCNRRSVSDSWRHLKQSCQMPLEPKRGPLKKSSWPVLSCTTLISRTGCQWRRWKVH
ncbi:hypothetical protein Pcinc_039631 [Petrolisthes cinctipes]|uniref:Uncharacterized protein n=1 Tax=Petrolisthes cinctipes TaxID=88211 RepID=A0AAE1BNL0_PETCI|nr:hypothetical protein Pcinc_039631 [Petrolisthes cinctipes]